MCGNPSIKKLYAKISLNVGGTYVQPLDQLSLVALIDEIIDGQIGEIWTAEIVEMDEKEYEGLPEFVGH